MQLAHVLGRVGREHPFHVYELQTMTRYDADMRDNRRFSHSRHHCTVVLLIPVHARLRFVLTLPRRSDFFTIVNIDGTSTFSWTTNQSLWRYKPQYTQVTYIMTSQKERTFGWKGFSGPD